MNIYAVYQTDVWQTLTSYVCFGYFETIDSALDEAEANGLLIGNKESNRAELDYFSIEEGTKVVIEEHTLGQYGERNGFTIREFDYAELNDCEECGTLCLDGDITFEEDETTLYFCSEECKGDYIHSLKHEDD